MGVKLKLEMSRYGKPENVELPHKLKYKIYSMGTEEWKKLQSLTSGLKSFLDALYKKQGEEYRKRIAQKLKLKEAKSEKKPEKSKK